MSCEQELITRAAQGDEMAVLSLYHQHKTAVYTYIYYRVGGDDAVAEEITADVFLRMVAGLPQFVYRERPLLAWLYTVARHCVADHFRQNGRFSQQPFPEQYPDTSAGPEQQAALSLERRRLLYALAQLTEAQRDVVILRFSEGRSVAETAVLLDKKKAQSKH